MVSLEFPKLGFFTWCYLLSVGDISEWIYLVGLPSNEYIGKRNHMGHMFRVAAERSKAEMIQDTFDNFIVRIKKTNKMTFLDALITVIALA